MDRYIEQYVDMLQIDHRFPLPPDDLIPTRPPTTPAAVTSTTPHVTERDAGDPLPTSNRPTTTSSTSTITTDSSGRFETDDPPKKYHPRHTTASYVNTTPTVTPGGGSSDSGANVTIRISKYHCGWYQLWPVGLYKIYQGE